MPGIVASPAGGPTPQVTDMFARGPDLDGPWFESIRALYCAQRSADAAVAGS